MKEINYKSEEGFADIALSILSVEKDSKGNFDIVANGKYQDSTVSLRVIVKGGMKQSYVKGKFDDQAFYEDGITFVSVGPSSDDFIKALGELYGKKAKKFSKEPVSFTCLALEEKKFNLQKDFVHFKLFSDVENKKGLYCELYCNINIPKKEIEIKEKDPGYRKNIIKTLGG